VIEKELP
jgi:WD40 repeat protein